MVRLFILALALTLAVPTLTRADQNSDCLHHKDENVRIRSCSEIINANPADAIAHYGRAAAHRIKGDVDRAVADYTRTIELKPNYASAYNERALVHAAKGDYASALADVTRATELTKQSTTMSSEPAASRSGASRRRFGTMSGRCGTYRFWNGERCLDARDRSRKGGLLERLASS